MVTIYHNPKCSKSRETLALLKTKDVEIKVVEYLTKPPSRKELKSILAMLGKKPQALRAFMAVPLAKMRALSRKVVSNSRFLARDGPAPQIMAGMPANLPKSLLPNAASGIIKRLRK